MTLPAAADARDLTPDLETVASLLRVAFIDGFEKGRASAVPAEVREAIEATKISLLVLTTFEEHMKGLLHPMMLKDLRCAIEANRHARRELLAALEGVGR